MKIVVNTQEELNNITLDFSGEIVIVGGTIDKPIILKHHYQNAYVILSGNAVIEMRESSQVNVMRESSQVNVMRGSSQVKEMRESSQVNVMWESSQVNVMRESSQVNVMRGSSQVNVMWGSSQVKEMWGTAIAKTLSDNTKINCFGYNYIFLEEGLVNHNITLNDTSQLIPFKTFNTTPSLDFYLKNYKVEVKEKSVIMFKAVHKINEEYVSDYDKNFKYKIGEKTEHEINTDINNSCNVGLHASNIEFALNFGRGWNDIAILEVEIPKDKIVVSKDCDGKIRTSEMTVLRELDKSEYEV